MEIFGSDEIREMYVRGVERNKKFMVIWCDTFDYEYYPSYYDTYEEMEKDINTEKEMRRYMESYDLTRMMEYQLRKNRNHVLELRLILPEVE